MRYKSSVGRNIGANYIGTIYNAIVGIAVLPLYIGYVGEEAFGLIGLYIMLQAWLTLLDLGLSPLLAREAAKSRRDESGSARLVKITHSLELMILVISLFTFLMIGYLSEWISLVWLSIGSLEAPKVIAAVTLIGLTIALRYFSSLYRSGLQGLERQVDLNVINVIIVTLRYFGALMLLRYVSVDITVFFTYQVLVGVIEIGVLSRQYYKAVSCKQKISIRIYLNEIIPVIPFATGIAYTALIAVVANQIDKLVMSNILPIHEYGYFTLVVIISTGIVQLSKPIGQAVLPRMTYLLSNEDMQKMLTLYRGGTQIVAVFIVPLSGVIAIYSYEILYLWSGEINAAEWGKDILFWFSLSSGILAVNSFQYHLQFAYGKLKLHVIYTSVMAIIQIPLLIYVAYMYGPLQVAVTWFFLRLLTLLVWTPYIHYKFAPGIHLRWLLFDIVPSILISLLILLISKDYYMFTSTYDEVISAVFIALVFIIIVIANIIMSPICRNLIKKRFWISFIN